MLLTDDARFVGLALAGSLLVRSTTGGAPWLAGRSRDPPPSSPGICDPMSRETKYRGLFSSLSVSSTSASRLYRIPVSWLLEYRFVEYRISVELQFSIFQNSTCWGRLCRIPICRLLAYIYIYTYACGIYRIAAGLEFLYPRAPHPGAVCTGSQYGGFWNIRLWIVECLLGWRFYILELPNLEQFVQDPSKAASGI